MRRLLLGAAMLCAPAALDAQNTSSAATPAPAPPPPPPPAAIGPAQLRDFQLQGQRRVVAPPPPAQAAPVQLAPPSPVTNSAATNTTAPARPAPAPARPAPQTTRPASAPVANVPVQTAPIETAPAPAPEAIPAPVEAPPPAPAPGAGLPWTWIYAAGGAALVIIATALLLRRRRRAAAEEEYFEEAPAAAPAPAPVAAPPPPPAAPEPPRPWLELALKAERATSTDDEAVVEFELELRNEGQAAARNLRIDVKMFNAGAEQDQEIGGFFRTAGRESTKCNLPGIPAATTGVIHGSVAMPRDEMRALKLEDRYLFVPVIAVNALYDYGDGRTGQTSKSYVVGRELAQPSEKMGAFRVDQGPRVWRTVGQRQHKLARRV